MSILSRFIIICIALMLSGCASYRPLYGNAGGTDVAAALASVMVAEQRTRAGQLVRNEVLSSAQTDGESLFELRMVPTETSAVVSNLPGTNTSRKRYGLSVAFELVDLKKGVVVTKGTSFSNVPYDTVREPIADLQAANNAQSRAAGEVGQDLRLRIAAYLATHSG